MLFREATGVVLSMIALQGLSRTAVCVSPTRPTAFRGNATVLAYLEGIADYATTLNLPSNSLQNASGGPMAGSTDSIFINGNLARVLLATYRLQGNSSKNVEYLRQGLAWCDTFVELQAEIESSDGRAAGYWGTGYGQWANCTQRPLRGDCAHSGDIYFGDTGTAVTALALCYRLSGETEAFSREESAHQVVTARKAKYMGALEKYAAFVLEGSAIPPVNKKGVVRSFVDPQSGAVGCGYYACLNRTEDNCANVPGDADLNCPSTHPYTIATGTTGGAFFAEMYNLTNNITYGNIAAAAMHYEASVALPSGEVPYILDGLNCTTALGSEGCHSVGGPWPFDTASYVTEGVAGLALLVPDNISFAFSQTLVQAFKPTVDFLLEAQNDDGFWGAIGSEDTARSPRVLSLLSWWVSEVDSPTYHDVPVHNAINKYIDFLLGPAGAPGAAYGVGYNSILTGMVGLAVADTLSFGVTF